ncbi:MAG: hypothetical protein MJ120_02540 [Clostridia bacterium]|nr:hypothetical protein [Clostridia bacterium]
MMQLNINEMFNKFGREIRLARDDGWSSPIYHGFIQPLRYKNKIYLDGVYTVIGFDNQGKYLYIGPPEHDLTRFDSTVGHIEADGVKYTIDRAEKVYYSDEPVYVWAIIREIVEVT